MEEDWIVGFTDGEGGFIISIHTKGEHYFRVGLKFILSQAESEILEETRKFFGGIGHLEESKKYPNNFTWVVNRKKELVKIRDFFRNHPPKTRNKKISFEAWSKALDIILEGRHLTPEGCVEIFKFRDQLINLPNRRGRHRFTAIDAKEILEGRRKVRPMAVPNAWSPEEEAFIRENYLKITVVEIANALGRTKNAVRSRARFLRVVHACDHRDGPVFKRRHSIFCSICGRVLPKEEGMRRLLGVT